MPTIREARDIYAAEDASSLAGAGSQRGATRKEGSMQQAIAHGSVIEVPISTRAKAVVTLIVIQLVATMAVIFGRLAEIGLLKRALSGATVTLAEATRSDDRMRTLGVVYLFSLAASGLAWLIWQYRAHRRLRGSGVRNLEFTPGWGVGWWFVPIANLAMPYKTVKELWRAGDLSSGAFLEGRATRTPILIWWWAAFLGANLVTRFGGDLGSDESIQDLLTRDYVLMIGSVLWIVAGIIAIVIVRGIDDRLEAIPTRTVPARPDVDAADATDEVPSRGTLVGAMDPMVDTLSAAVPTPVGRGPEIVARPEPSLTKEGPT